MHQSARITSSITSASWTRRVPTPELLARRTGTVHSPRSIVSLLILLTPPQSQSWCAASKATRCPLLAPHKRNSHPPPLSRARARSQSWASSRRSRPIRPVLHRLHQPRREIRRLRLGKHPSQPFLRLLSLGPQCQLRLSQAAMHRYLQARFVRDQNLQWEGTRRMVSSYLCQLTWLKLTISCQKLQALHSVVPQERYDHKNSRVRAHWLTNSYRLEKVSITPSQTTMKMRTMFLGLLPITREAEL
jgi:hypothetical protein